MVEFSNEKNYFFATSDLPRTNWNDSSNLDELLAVNQEAELLFSEPFICRYPSYSLYSAHNQSIWHRKDHVVPPVSLALLKDIIIREWDFTIYSASKNKLLLNSIGGHRARHDPDGSNVFDGFIKDKYEKITTEKIPVILCNDGLRNYWHWHAQTMMALLFLQEFKLTNSALFITTKLNRWQRQCLEALNIDFSQVLELPGGYYHFDRALYPSYLDPRAFINIDPYFAEVFRTVQKNYSFSLRENTSVAQRKRIYVSRQDAPHRTMQNEHELISALNHFGFEEVVPSKMTYAEQVKTFSSAEIVVGIHGAGLTNIGFLPPSALAIEICDINYMNYVYYILSRLVGCKYETILTSVHTADPDGTIYWTPDITSILQSIARFSEIHGFKL